MRFELKPDAGDLGEAAFLGGVFEGVDFERVLFDTPSTSFLEGMILRDTPVEYRLRPCKRAAIDTTLFET